MERYERLALVAATVDALNQHDSRASRAHVHKTMYFVQRWSGLEPPYSFIIYQYGPYAFQLDEDIGELLSFSALSSEAARDGYGVRYATGKPARSLVADYERALAPWQPVLEFAADQLGTRKSNELQLLGTTAIVLGSLGEVDQRAIVAEVRRLKPQYSESEVEQAIREVKALDAEAERYLASGDAAAVAD